MQKLRAQLAQYGDSPSPVLIEGESGSGKEIVARCLHYATSRRHQPFLALNCAAISPSLVEPTLFGHAKGAFTGAAGAKAGYFEDAGEGTLFLDEIGELPPELQAKLLRVLENGEYQRVGETQTAARGHASSPRRTATCAGNSAAAASAPTFTTACRYSASAFPALREMADDRLLLLDHYRQHYAKIARQTPLRPRRERAPVWLGYPFPGNVRELRNIVIRLTAKFPGARWHGGTRAGTRSADEDIARISAESGRRATADRRRHEASAGAAAVQPRRALAEWSAPISRRR